MFSAPESPALFWRQNERGKKHMRLYQPLFDWSVVPSVGPTVRLSQSHFSRFSAPAHPSATNAAMYTALFLETRLRSGFVATIVRVHTIMKKNNDLYWLTRNKIAWQTEGELSKDGVKREGDIKVTRESQSVLKMTIVVVNTANSWDLPKNNSAVLEREWLIHCFYTLDKILIVGYAINKNIRVRIKLCGNW